MSKWDRFQSSVGRAHEDLFFASEYSAEFINTSVGSRDNKTDEFTGETETSLGSIDVEIVPPAMDTTIRETGTSFSWDTSIRFPTEDKPGELVPLGNDNRKPTIVKISDPEDDGTDDYELHGYSYEKGSGMLMCRLVEQ
jgi:hypothetical protein